MHQLRSLIQGDDLPVDSCKGATVFDSMEAIILLPDQGSAQAGLAVLGQQDLPLKRTNGEASDDYVLAKELCSYNNNLCLLTKKMLQHSTGLRTFKMFALMRD